jgi:hypothetical protein
MLCHTLCMGTSTTKTPEEKLAILAERLQAVQEAAMVQGIHFNAEHLLKAPAWATEYVKFDQKGVWAVEASVSVDLVKDENQTTGFSAAVQVNWSSTYRSLANAMVAVKMYQRAIEFAALVETTINR